MRPQPTLPLALLGLAMSACTIKLNTSESDYQDKDAYDQDDWGDKDEDSWGDKDEDSWGDKDEDSWGDKDEDSWGDKDEDSWGDKDEDSWGDKDEAEEGNCDNTSHTGYRTITVGGETREYILHVPANYDSTSPTPLVLNFHGFGGCAADYAEYVGGSLGLNSTADSNNFIVAYPQAMGGVKGGSYWDPGSDGSQSIGNDVVFTEQLIAAISDQLNVDTAKVYATGYSNGGMMAYELACTGSDFIAAAGIMSGIMLGNECAQSETTSIIHFHGVADGAIPYDGSGDFQAVSDVVAIWLTQNDISSANRTTTQLNNGDVVRDVYTGGRANTSVVLYTVNSEHNQAGGHVWFSEDIDGISPNQILWDFLSSYRVDD